MGTRRVEDSFGNFVCLFESPWGMNHIIENNPKLRFLSTALDLSESQETVA